MSTITTLLYMRVKRKEQKVVAIDHRGVKTQDSKEVSYIWPLIVFLRVIALLSIVKTNCRLESLILLNRSDYLVLFYLMFLISMTAFSSNKMLYTIHLKILLFFRFSCISNLLIAFRCCITFKYVRFCLKLSPR